MSTRNLAVMSAIAVSIITAACAPVIQESRPSAGARELSAARTLDIYKQHVARRIVQTNTGWIADSLPPILESVVVLDITIDRDGEPVNVSIRRSNGLRDLEQAAIASVRRARPFPVPPAELLNGARAISYAETWLFRSDRRFQVRSIAQIQPSG
jgi:protein TonB